MLDKKEVNKLTRAAAKLFNTFLEGQKPSEFLPPHAWTVPAQGRVWWSGRKGRTAASLHTRHSDPRRLLRAPPESRETSP